MEVNLIIELGGSYISIYKKNSGLIFRQASLLAVSLSNGEYEIKGFGDNAETLASIEDPNINVFSPFNNGEIKSFDYAQLLLSLAIKEANLKQNFVLNKAIMLTNCGLKLEDKEEYQKLFKACGIDVKYFIPSVFGIANQYGHIQENTTAMMVCDMGSQGTSVAVLNKNGILHGSYITLGGKAMTVGIMNMLEEKYNIQVSMFIAKKVKEELANLVSYDNSTVDVKGFDIHSKQEKVVTVKALDIRQVLTPYFDEIITQISGVLDLCSDEVLKQIKMNGVLLGGQVAKTIGIEQYFKNKLTLMTSCTEDIEVCAILGMGKLLKNKMLLQTFSYK